MDLSIIGAAAINGLLLGGIYTLVASGLTLIYGVLHIINFAHGSMLMLAMYGVYFLLTKLGIDPYLSVLIMVPVMYAAGYLLYRFVIGKFSSGKDENILLITLGLSILLENLALMFFKGDSRTISVDYLDRMVDLGPAMVSLPKLISFVTAMVLCAVLGLVIQRTDMGRSIRAVAREKMGAQLVGINVEHVFAMAYGIGLATLGAAACLLMPIFYVAPSSGHAFVMVAFTIVVLGGMGSFRGAIIGGLIVGLTESFGGLFLGESLGQIGISLIFILILLFRPAGLFGVQR
ncbi:branched-chain amino acid ABC transporter permease [Actimicrobium sp. CCI2.3]|uniref:branched-chain amino acid ABC transporter permease n=1 Tax=Actimicrobium sp. CCI2.3 TaxID=3048616 RepID=UPI002AB3D5F0|nr:branched-chain amino acid ABC transporter permease [Actimicrobium sp. CCI2.3]MDY7574400.1 branched-chain amino acid ABC transporter permease [Actimicrobium sp. CCI2.3]MEB0022521.1 branched-chain amino acid ABC transporter permease [Actimicrobium sp. CCI2.3]